MRYALEVDSDDVWRGIEGSELKWSGTATKERVVVGGGKIGQPTRVGDLLASSSTRFPSSTLAPLALQVEPPLSPFSSTYNPSPVIASSTPSSSSLNLGLGVGFGSLALLVIGVGGIWWWERYRARPPPYTEMGESLERRQPDPSDS